MIVPLIYGTIDWFQLIYSHILIKFILSYLWMLRWVPCFILTPGHVIWIWLEGFFLLMSLSIFFNYLFILGQLISLHGVEIVLVFILKFEYHFAMGLLNQVNHATVLPPLIIELCDGSYGICPYLTKSWIMHGGHVQTIFLQDLIYWREKLLPMVFVSTALDRFDLHAIAYAPWSTGMLFKM